MSKPRKSEKIRLIGVPMDLGQSRRGVDMGPSAVRYAQLQARLEGLGYHLEDCGNVTVPPVEEIEGRKKSSKSGSGRVYHLDAVAHVCESIFRTVTAGYAEGDFTIVLGGDHSISIGSIASMAQHGPIGVIWVDAHADYNTPQTSPSGNIHGMSVAVLLGDGPDALVNVGYPGPKLQPAQVAMIGIRTLDYKERLRLTNSGIAVLTMTDIDEAGMAACARQALSHLAGFDAIHVSLDMDCLDPDIAPGVGTPVRGGFTYREAHLLMEILASAHKVRSMDIVEINPILDTGNQTAELAVELTASLLGKRII